MGMWSVPGVRASKRDLRDMWRTAMIDMLFNGVGWADIAPSRAPRSGVIVGRLVWAIGKGACRLMLYLATKDGEPVPSRAPPSSGLRACDCSYCERMSPKDSLGSLLVWESGPVARS